MSAASATGAVQVVRIRNKTDREQELWIEPLGDRVVLSPNVLYELAATDALEEIDFSLEGFVVYGWVTKVTSIDKQGTKATVWELP